MKLDSKINLSDQSELKPLSCVAKIDQNLSSIWPSFAGEN